MMKLFTRHRLRIPNQLAMLAAVLLLVSSVVGYESQQTASSSAPEAIPAATKRVDSDDTARRRAKGLNLGLLLFRRG